jgi:2-amino-4-hydroxy-6-hydroxymethyldihydropteridine diphosphokinase
MSPNNVYLSLGSNLGNRENNILAALKYLSKLEGFEIIAFSPIYITEPVEMDRSNPSFLN